MKTARLLRAVYKSCLEGERAYRLAFEEESDPDLKSLFNSYSLQRAKFARQLREAVSFIGWQHLASGVGEDVNELDPTSSCRSSGAILDDCAKGEDIAVRRYQEALAADLSNPVRELLTRQLNEVEAVSERIRQLRDLAQPT